MFARVVAVLLVGASAVIAADVPPKISLDIPQAFKVRVFTRHFRKGQVIVAEPAYARMTALASFMEYSGYFGDPNADQDHLHLWHVAVYRALNQKTVSAYTSAKDGYEANLNESPEFLGCGDTSYMFARFGRKHFRWGDGVSFLSQFTQNTGVYVPHNGHLTYEVWGFSRDHRFTVVASVSVSHSKLAAWVAEKPELRDARSLEALKKTKTTNASRGAVRVSSCRVLPHSTKCSTHS
jgi:hypothetical protein